MNTRDCPLCGWVDRDGRDLPGWCPRCRARTVADVADLPELWRTLGSLLVPGAAGEQQRVAGSKSPPLPLRLDVANLRGPATAGARQGRDQHGSLSIATVLAVVRAQVRDVCGLPADHRGGLRSTEAQLDADTRFLLVWLDRYAERAPGEEVAAVAGALQDIRRRAWGACGYTAHRVLLGPCPKQVEPGLSCGRDLWIDPVLDSDVRCRDCGTLWDRKYFLWLRRVGQETA